MGIKDQLFDFTEFILSAAPEEPGVYSLWHRAELIYYGRALGGTTTIRSRLLSHLRGTEGKCTQSATHYSWEMCPEPARREVQLLTEFQSAYGRLPRCNERVG